MDHRVQIARARRFLRNHASEDIQLETIARAAGASMFHLARLYRALTGDTVGHALTRTRIERAALRLEEPGSISAIALEVGFGTPSSLTKAFREALGMSPTQYRAATPAARKKALRALEVAPPIVPVFTLGEPRRKKASAMRVIYVREHGSYSAISAPLAWSQLEVRIAPTPFVSCQRIGASYGDGARMPSDALTYDAGVIVGPRDVPPIGTEVMTLSGGAYLVFEYRGDFRFIEEAFTQIFQRRIAKRSGPCLELYRDDPDHAELWIPRLRSTMRTLLLALAACAAHPVAPAPAVTPVGFETFDGVDPVRHGTLPMAFFYPASGAVGQTMIGWYPVAATKQLPIAAGTFPLIAISHGHTGTMWGHHDLATALASHGYIVAVVEHVGDSYRDQQPPSDGVLLGRAYQLSATIDAALADPVVGAHIDRDRIGVAGFSAGGWTSLLVVGAKPDFTQVAGYCKQHPTDDNFCGFDLARTLETIKPTIDPRVKAAFVMSPLAVMFGDDAFAAIKAPLFLYYGTADQVLLPEANAAKVLRAPTLRGSRKLDGAGHYVFLTPCGPEATAKVPELCLDPPGIDRARIHAQIETDIVTFFDTALTAARR